MKLGMFSATHKSVTAPISRGWKIRTALRTNQIEGFVTVPSRRKNDILYCTRIKLRVKIFKRLTTTCPISSTVSLFVLKVKKENYIFGLIRIQSEEARWRFVQLGKHTSRYSMSISHERISDNMSHFALLHWHKKGFINIGSQASVPFIEWTSSKER